MKIFNGIPASPGIAIHRVVTYYPDIVFIPSYAVDKADTEDEWNRYEEAVKQVAHEIRGIYDKLESSAIEQRYILEAQLLMLHDPEMNKHVYTQLKETQTNVESILSKYIESIVNLLETSGDEYLAERSIDILDISRRITNKLLYKERNALALIDEDSILVAPNLLPTETIQLNTDRVLGIALDAGGRMSHTAIFARSLGIPAVFGCMGLCRTTTPHDLIIVDGDEGRVVVNPDEKTLLHYREKLVDSEKRESSLDNLREFQAKTLDGQSIFLMANIETPGEIEFVQSANADGIGLLRTEFLFIKQDEHPGEDVQMQEYRYVLEAMGVKPTTIRTLDIGGDKLLSSMNSADERNPLLGCRAIRYCIREEELFRTQLRALLRASAHGNLRIMFPLISNVEELDMAKKILEEERNKLMAAGILMAAKIPVGIMIEVPSAACISDILARHADFFSIGTNDLIQYTMAVDRGNEKVADLYQPWHPALWRLIKLTVDNAMGAGIPVSVCGEVANDPAAAVLLMALGLKELSMSSFYIPKVKSAIRSINIREAEDVLDEVMEADCAASAEAIISRSFGTSFAS